MLHVCLHVFTTECYFMCVGSINYIYFFLCIVCVRRKGEQQQALSHLADRKDERHKRQKRKGDLCALTEVWGVGVGNPPASPVTWLIIKPLPVCASVRSCQVSVRTVFGLPHSMALVTGHTYRQFHGASSCKRHPDMGHHDQPQAP